MRTHGTIIDGNIWCVGKKICHLCDSFGDPLPQNMLGMPAMFVSSIVFDVINEMQVLFATKTVSCYLPRDQTLKINVQEIRQKLGTHPGEFHDPYAPS